MKRFVAKLVIFLLLGAIINVAVAWGCALFVQLSDDWPNSDPQAEFGSPGDPSAPGAWEAWVLTQPGLEYVCIAWTHEIISWMGGSEASPRSIIPFWARNLEPTRTERLTHSAERVAVASGWPYVAMHSLVAKRFDDSVVTQRNVFGLETALTIV